MYNVLFVCYINFVLGNKFIVKQKKVFESIGIPTTKTKGSSRGNCVMDIIHPFKSGEPV